jgi:hypothetical protein
LGSESETCVGSRVRLVGVSISFEKNFYRLPFTPPLSGSPYRSFTLEIMWLQENTHKRSENPIFYGPCHATLVEELLPHGIHVSMSHHRSKGGNPWQITQRHMDFTWIGGPTRVSNQLKYIHTPRMYPRAHISVIVQKMGANGPQGFGRTNHVSVHPGLKSGAPWLVPQCVRKVLSVLLRDPPRL